MLLVTQLEKRCAWRMWTAWVKTINHLLRNYK